MKHPPVLICGLRAAGAAVSAQTPPAPAAAFPAQEKLQPAVRDFQQAFAGATNRAEREAAAEKFSRAVGGLTYETKMSAAQACEFVLKTMLPRLEANLAEAGVYVMALDSRTYDREVLSLTRF
jgi:hypothetical protein